MLSLQKLCCIRGQSVNLRFKERNRRRGCRPSSPQAEHQPAAGGMQRALLAVHPLRQDLLGHCCQGSLPHRGGYVAGYL